MKQRSSLALSLQHSQGIGLGSRDCASAGICFHCIWDPMLVIAMVQHQTKPVHLALPVLNTVLEPSVLLRCVNPGHIVDCKQLREWFRAKEITGFSHVFIFHSHVFLQKGFYPL